MNANLITEGWIPVEISLPKEEGYYQVKFIDGTEDEKPFRIRPRKNIYGFMSMTPITHWKPLSYTDEL